MKKKVNLIGVYILILMIIICIITTIVLQTQHNTEQVTHTIGLFREEKIKHYSIDFASKLISMKLHDGTTMELKIRNPSEFINKIEPYVSEYNKKNPTLPIQYDYIPPDKK